MPDIAALRELREKLRAGNDRGGFVRGFCVLWTDHSEYPGIASLVVLATSETITALGAAAAMAELVLPDASWRVESDGSAIVSTDRLGDHHAVCATPVLAILDALLSALIARAEAALSSHAHGEG